MSSRSAEDGATRRPVPEALPPVESSSAEADPKKGRGRFAAFWVRHRTLFWTIHSLWALATGVAVIYLARERYGFIPWVVSFLVITWISTLFFGRTMAGPSEESDVTVPPGLGHEATSYLTRSMYQETLFFLLPFYWYSTVVWSPNVLFPVLLATLAVLSCIDLLFDRWLRQRPMFGLVFFATVAFAAINLLLPILLPVDPVIGTPIAAAAAVGSAVPLALHGAVMTRSRGIGSGLVAVVLLGLPIAFPRLIPPVPLRLQHALFTSDLDRDTLVPADTLNARVSPSELAGALFVLVEVFAPSSVATEVSLEWQRDGRPFRTSREIEIVAHDLGFRVWDAWRPDTGSVPDGRYEVILSTAGHRVFGKAQVVVGGGS